MKGPRMFVKCRTLEVAEQVRLILFRVKIPYIGVEKRTRGWAVVLKTLDILSESTKHQLEALGDVKVDEQL